MENKILAIVDLHSDANLNPLTDTRPLAVTTFAGRYTFLDFVLSNFTRNNIDDIAILCKEQSGKIDKHIGRDSTYLKNTKTGNLKTLRNEEALGNPQFNTDLNNLVENDYILYDNPGDFVIVCPTYFVMNVDWNELIKLHIKSQRAISVLYKPTEDYEQFTDCDKITVDAIGDAQKFEHINDRDKGKKINVSLKTYIINRSLFEEIVKKAKEISSLYTISDIVKYISQFYQKVNCIEIQNFVLCFNSFKKYFQNSLALIGDDVGSQVLGNKSLAIYTSTHNSRPVIYGEVSDVQGAIIANGCTINGKVRNCILGRDVIIEEGAVVENCVLFSHTTVKKGIHISNLVANKRVVFKTKTEVHGTFDDPLYIPGGSII
jgi:glucose-1-phosphate adenylyltransferase